MWQPVRFPCTQSDIQVSFGDEVVEAIGDVAGSETLTGMNSD